MANFELPKAKDHLTKCPDLATAEKRYRDHLVSADTSLVKRNSSSHENSSSHPDRPLHQDDCSHRLGGDHPDTIAAVNTLALLLFRSRKLEESEHLYVSHLLKTTVAADARLACLSAASLMHFFPPNRYRRALLADTRRLGEDHEETLAALNNLAVGILGFGGWGMGLAHSL